MLGAITKEGDVGKHDQAATEQKAAKQHDLAVARSTSWVTLVIDFGSMAILL